ncbi:MAG: hypothetical protein HQK77_04715 [Desulfobacterales bacterium]|nr:hypothetical protein [Desulfobacterales bacterium]
MAIEYKVTIIDKDLKDIKADDVKDSFILGHYFLFYEKRVLPERRKRLQLTHQPKKKIFPFLDQPINIIGIQIERKGSLFRPLCCIVTDRELYQSGRDTVSVFIACPNPPADIQLHIQYHNNTLIQRNLQLENGIGIERFEKLPPGEYTASLSWNKEFIGTPATFTIAEYCLAPLSAQLGYYKLDRMNNCLEFELTVDSYQVPFNDSLKIGIENSHDEELVLNPDSPGSFKGKIAITEQIKGNIKLRVQSINDNKKIAEVVIPGSTLSERRYTTISELGDEMLFSMMPEQNAIPIKSGYLTKGDYYETALTIDHVLSDSRSITINQNVKDLIIICYDMLSAHYTVQELGDVSAGTVITLQDTPPLLMVFAGCYLNDEPFEGYATFLKPNVLQLTLKAPEKINCGEDLSIKIYVNHTSDTVPVLLSIRDARLISLNQPDIKLGADLKQIIEERTDDMNKNSFSDLSYAISNSMREPDRIVPQHPPRFQESNEDIDIPTFLRRAVSDEIFSYPIAAKRMITSPTIQNTTKIPEKKPIVNPEAKTYADFFDVQYYEIIHVQGGVEQEVLIPLKDTTGTLIVDAFALHHADWFRCESRVFIEKPLRIDFDFPPYMYSKDKAQGFLRVQTASGNAMVILKHNGNQVKLKTDQHSESNNGYYQTPVIFTVDVQPGEYIAELQDMISHERDTARFSIQDIGKLTSLTQTYKLLSEGDYQDLSSSNAISLKLVTSLDLPLKTLLQETSNYAHLCCEQLAAKILADTYIYLLSSDTYERKHVETRIILGIEREKRHFISDRGFAMYEGKTTVNINSSKLVVRYLWHLSQLDELPDSSPQLKNAVKDAIFMAGQIAIIFDNLEPLEPNKIETIEDAYTMAITGRNTEEVKKFIFKILKFTKHDVRLLTPKDAVSTRCTLAYAAATLFALNCNIHEAFVLANRVMREFKASGMLYSTMDSASAITMLIQLKRSQILENQKLKLIINGQKTDTLPDEIKSIQVIEGKALIAMNHIIQEDWLSLKNTFPVKVHFENDSGQPIKYLSMGDKIHLVVSIPKYEIGDILHVILPPSLAWIYGGGQIKKFTIDFEENNSLRIPLVVISQILQEQHFVIYVKNMYIEERVSCPGLLSVKAKK